MTNYNTKMKGVSMKKKELLAKIRETQKDMKKTMENLQYNINDLDEIRMAVALAVPDDFKAENDWTKDDNLIREEKRYDKKE